MSGAFGEIGAALHIRDPGPPMGLSIYAVPKQSNPGIMATLFDGPGSFVGPDGDIRWTVRWSVRNRPGRVGAAIYQSAYLMMFAYYGYDFAFRTQYETLRQQILQPDEAIWPGRINVFPLDEVGGQLVRREGTIMFVREPEPCVAVALKFQPAEGRERILGVLLPGPESDDGRVPTFESGSLNGSVVPYRPEVLPMRPRDFLGLWHWVQARGR